MLHYNLKAKVTDINKFSVSILDIMAVFYPGSKLIKVIAKNKRAAEVLKSQTDLCTLANNIPLKINGAVLQITLGNVFRIYSVNAIWNKSNCCHMNCVMRCLLQSTRRLLTVWLMGGIKIIKKSHKPFHFVYNANF